MNTVALVAEVELFLLISQSRLIAVACIDKQQSIPTMPDEKGACHGKTSRSLV